MQWGVVGLFMFPVASHDILYACVCMCEWGALRMCVSGAALWWFMYRFHSLNQNQFGKSPRSRVWWLSLLTDNSEAFKHGCHSFPAGLGLASHFCQKKKKSINLNFSCHYPPGIILPSSWRPGKRGDGYMHATCYMLHAKAKLWDGSRFLLCQSCDSNMFALEVMMEKLLPSPSATNWNILLASLGAHVSTTPPPPMCSCGGGKASQIHRNASSGPCVVSSLKLEADNHDCIRMLLSWDFSCSALRQLLLESETVGWSCRHVSFSYLPCLPL